jgi:hypothetical protein
MIGNAKAGKVAASCEVIRGGVVVRETHALGVNAALLEGKSRLTVHKDATNETHCAFEMHFDDFSSFKILAPWGDPVPDRPGLFTQSGDHGAFVLMKRDDPNWTWVVDRPTFHRVYKIVPNVH